MIPPVVQPGDEFQRIRMPNAVGDAGKSLRIVSVSGNLAQFEWVDVVATEDLQSALVAGDGIIINGVPGSGADPFGSLLVAGAGIDVAYNTTNREWTVTNTGGVGGGDLDFGTFASPAGFTLDLGTF